MTTSTDDEKAAFEDQMKLVYQASANGAMILPERMREDFFNALTAWTLEHHVGCEKDLAGEWRDCEWQREIILDIHEIWAGFAYEEPDD
jgi:hypothetical protein